MSAPFGGPDNGLEPRDWLLECEGWRVEDENGRLIGHVAAPVYEPSARWDRPRALAVRGPAGDAEVALVAVARVDVEGGRIVVE
jgi:hypothetical protein